jgi:hypothetical protein
LKKGRGDYLELIRVGKRKRAFPMQTRGDKWHRERTRGRKRRVEAFVASGARERIGVCRGWAKQVVKRRY